MRGVLACVSMSVMGVLAGCQADYSADLTNKTPQPVYVQLAANADRGPGLVVNKRLGPGDRVFVGPIRADAGKGATLTVDTLPNPTRPLSIFLRPGAYFYEIRQDSPTNDGRLEVIEK